MIKSQVLLKNKDLSPHKIFLWKEMAIVQFQKISMLPQWKGFFFKTPLPLWKFQLSFIRFFKFFGLTDTSPSTPQEIPIPSVGEIWIFLELHNATSAQIGNLIVQNNTCVISHIYLRITILQIIIHHMQHRVQQFGFG